MSMAMADLMPCVSYVHRKAEVLQTIFLESSNMEGSHELQTTATLERLKLNPSTVSSDRFILDRALFIALIA